MKMIINPRKRNNCYIYLFILLVVCCVMAYIINNWTPVITNTIVFYSRKKIISSKAICYLSDGNTFTRDHLKKLVIREMDTASAYVTENETLKMSYMPKNYRNLTEFIVQSRRAVMSSRLIKSSHSIKTIFRIPPYKDMVKPSCDGLWLEFGVYRGKTISDIAKWKRVFCGNKSKPVYGFDTFSGLPTDWRNGRRRGDFNIPNGTKISVPSNVVLVKGLFIDTLPGQLLQFDRQHRCHTPVSFVHIDCDIYDGTRDIMFLLGSRFVSGTILVFDELFNYPEYEKHEIKALFEFLSGSNLRLIPVGSSTYIRQHPMKDTNIQSFAFVVDIKEIIL